MKNKFKRLLFTAVLLLLLTFIVTSCDKGHKHNFGNYQAEIPATCTENGVKAHYECGDCHKYFDKDKNEITDLVIPALGHTYGNLISEVPSTCTENGVKAHYECSACHKYFDEEKHEITDLVIPALGHAYGSLISEVSATCTENGVKAHYECSACHKYFDEEKHEITDLVIQALGHTYGNLISEVSATCTENGVKAHYECSACHKYFDEEKHEITDLVIPALGHTYGSLISEVPSTCTENGVKAHYECSACHKYFDEEKHEITDLVIPASHTYLLIPENPASCTAEGHEAYYRCSACRTLFNMDKEVIDNVTIIPALGHQFDSLHPAVAATDEECGQVAHHICLHCGIYVDEDYNVIDTIIISPLAHNFTSWIPEIPATCTMDGSLGHYCCTDEGCDALFDKNYKRIDSIIIRAHGHDLSELIEASEPTCLEKGNIAYYECKNCCLYFDAENKQVDKITIDKTAHSFGEWVDRIEPTCSSDGMLGHKTCTLCHKDFDINDKEIKSLVLKAEHKLNYVEGKEATCESDGFKGYFECSECHIKLDEFGHELGDLLIPATNHSLSDLIIGREATCLANGAYDHYECKDCGKYFDVNGDELLTIIIPKSNHTYTTEAPITKSPGHMTEGELAHYHCSICNHDFAEDGKDITGNILIAAIGHPDAILHGFVKSSCDTHGAKEYYECSECNIKYFKFDPFTAITDEDIILPFLNHEWEYVKKVEPTCLHNGCEEYYRCIYCDRLHQGNEEQTVEYIDLIIESLGHEYSTLIAAKAATETEDGVIEHYDCLRCGTHFDTSHRELESIIIPATNHTMSEWQDAIEMICNSNQEGRKGYYYCDHCNKYFDESYNEYAGVTSVDDLVIPITHRFGELHPAHESTDCHETILISYYQCEDCFHIFNENKEEINVYSFESNCHDFFVTDFNSGYHDLVCIKCGLGRIYENHDFEYAFYNKNGASLMSKTCKTCGYSERDLKYDYVFDIVLTSDYYVGVYYFNEPIFRIEMLNNAITAGFSILSSADQYRFREIVTLLENDKSIVEPIKETFTVRYNNCEKEIEIKFIPFALTTIKTSSLSYMKGCLSSLDDIRFKFDTPIEYWIYSELNIIDDGGFKIDYDFEANGVDHIDYTLVVSYKGIEYNVDLRYTCKEEIIAIDENINAFVGEEISLNCRYSNYNYNRIELLDEYIIDGLLDRNKPGVYNVTIKIDNYVTPLTITIKDNSQIYLDNDRIALGDDLYFTVHGYGGHSTKVKLTSDMIIHGCFDNNKVGTYKFIFSYNGIKEEAIITVYDPYNIAIEDILIDYSAMWCWKIVDGKLVPNLTNIYLYVIMTNGNRISVPVTLDMLEYDVNEVNNLVTNFTDNTSFDAKIKYEGYEKDVSIGITTEEKMEIRTAVVTKNDSSTDWRIAIKDGSFDGYYIKVYTYNGMFFVPLTIDNVLIYDDQTMTYQKKTLEEIESGEYDVRLVYGDYTIYSVSSAIFYTEKEIKHSIYVSNSDSIVLKAGSKESVLKQLASLRISYITSYSDAELFEENVPFEKTQLAYSDDIDFSKEGIISIKIGYKDASCELLIHLVDASGSYEIYSYYSLEGIRVSDVYVYENGYANLDSSWFKYQVINGDIIIISSVSLTSQKALAIKDENAKTIKLIKAEEIGGIEETYYLNRNGEELMLNVYTKNGFSFADGYYAEDEDYLYSIDVHFTKDGKYLVISGLKYLINGERLENYTPNSDVVFSYYFEGDDFNEHQLFEAYAEGICAIYYYIGNKKILTEVYAWQQNGDYIVINQHEYSIVPFRILPDNSLEMIN